MARRRNKWKLSALLAGVTPEKVGGEFVWGKSVGNERLCNSTEFRRRNRSD